MKRFCRWMTEDIHPDAIKSFTKATQEKHGLRDLHMSWAKTSGHLRLNDLAVHKHQHGQGIGSKAMKDITSFADEHKVPMALTTGTRDPHYGTTSGSRLKKFYKRHGFKENKGRSKDFRVRDNMIRPAKISKEDA